MFDFDVITDIPQTSRMIKPADSSRRAPAAPPTSPRQDATASAPPAKEQTPPSGVK